MDRDDLFKTFLKLYTFKDWEEGSQRDPVYKSNVSLIVTTACNTKCTYCYYKNYGKELYPSKAESPANIVKNSKLLMDWFLDNGFRVDSFDIFSGEFFNLSYYRAILDNIKDYFSRAGIERGFLSIPTNGTFLLDEKKTEEIEALLADFQKEKIDVYLSLSIDGKYLDNDTRAIRNGTLYDDAFYEKAFRFYKKYGFGFHPMVSAEGISKWKENYLWFIDNFLQQRGNIDAVLRSMYLLEVRNPDWKVKELKELEDFILFFVEDLFQRLGRDKKSFVEKLAKTTNLNFLSSFTNSIGRGIGCSEQMDFEVRLGDLAIVPCHRTSYEGFNGGYFKVEDDKIVDIVSENPETYIMFKTFDARNSPGCVTCPISELCSKYCMGANMEVNKDFYVPVETVCRMEFVKALSITKAFMNIGVLDYVIDVLKKSTSTEFIKKVFQINCLRDMIKKETLENGIYRG